MYPKDWSNRLSTDSFREYGKKIFGANAAAEVMQGKSRKSTVEKVKIQLDEKGIPVWPEEDEENPWNLETKKKLIRDFLNAHWSAYLRSIFLRGD